MSTLMPIPARPSDLICNQGVGGSSPSAGTNKINNLGGPAGGECFPEMAPGKHMGNIYHVASALQAWASGQPEAVRAAAIPVLQGLWVCANNVAVPLAFARGLADAVAALEAVHKSSLTESTISR